MQFHHHGYVSGDPRVEPAAGVGLHRPESIPEEVDVLIVGAGPAGMITAAQLSQFPSVTTRIVDGRAGRLEVGRADGIQARSVETFQAFGFADRLVEEAFRITRLSFWKPDPSDPTRIVRTARNIDDPTGLSEFPHIIVNQARILDHLSEFMGNSPSRMSPDYGYTVVDVQIGDHPEHPEHPVQVHLLHTDGARKGQQQRVWAKYVVGADGAHSTVRKAIGCSFDGQQANHAWGVMDVLATTDFPDIRSWCTIQSSVGNILLIPREGGFLIRLYVDLGEVGLSGDGDIRGTTVEETIERAQAILHPYTLDVKDVVWFSVYEVGHRISDRFDDVLPRAVGAQTPRAFVVGDACHTHSAKGGQGMNISMQDGFNLGWKLGHVLDGRSSESILSTYTAERWTVARDLIEFDKSWSTLMARRPEDLTDPTQLETFYAAAEEFRTGFMTEYPPSAVVATTRYQQLAPGFPVGRRFASHRVLRVADEVPVHLGHQARADGRWRIYVLADDAPVDDPRSAVAALSRWLSTSPHSPLVRASRCGVEPTDWFDVKLVIQVPHVPIDLRGVPEAFLPRVGPYQLVDYEHVFGALASEDLFRARGVDRDGVVVVVRPDHYVAHVVPLTATYELADFFAGVMRAPDAENPRPKTLVGIERSPLALVQSRSGGLLAPDVESSLPQ